MSILPDHDKLQTPSDSPYWNESAFFAFLIPERNIDGFVYIWHRPNMNLCAGGIAFWDHTGSHSSDCLYYDFNYLQASPDGAEMFDFELDGGLAIHCREPLMSYDLSYVGDGCTLDLDWRGIIEPQALHFSDHAGVKSWGNGHYEQAGHVVGTIVLEGERLEVDSYANRDRTWGPRLPNAGWKSGGFEWANVSESHGFCATSMRTAPLESDLLFGTTEKIAYGWYTKDGVVSQLSSGERRVTARGHDGRPELIEVGATDGLGRSFTAQGRVKNALSYHGLWFCYWGLVEWTLDGEHAWGESQDFYRPRLSRRLKRSSIPETTLA